MSTKSTVAYGQEWHLYTNVLEDEGAEGRLYIDVQLDASLEERDPHLPVARATAAITIALPDKLVDAIVAHRAKVSVSAVTHVPFLLSCDTRGIW